MHSIEIRASHLPAANEESCFFLTTMAAASRRQLIILVLLLGLAPHSFRLPANAQNAQLPHT